MNPFFTIIIPTYNREVMIKDAVDSVLNQTYPHFELIIVDDGSTDATQGLLNLMPDERLRVITQDNHGPAHARNQGIAAAKHDWICFLDSDDRFLSRKLDVTQQAIADNPDIKVFHTQERWFKDGREVAQQTRHRNPHGDAFATICDICSISISTACIHRCVFADIGPFDESFPACEDYELWLRVTARYPVHLIAETLTEKDGGRPDQLTSQIWGLDRFRIKALEKMLQSGTLEEGQTRVCREALLKKCAQCLRGAKKHRNRELAEKCEALIRLHSE